METPSSSSSRSIIRKIDESGESGRMKTGPREDRSALIDITNDSPIVGLAKGSLKTPATSKNKRVLIGRTPGSGEALLRGQVKTLLQKVEEEAELSNRSLITLLKSTISRVAPTPANTPQILNDGVVSCLPCLTPMIVSGEKTKEEGSVESEDLVTRSLLLEFSEKSSESDTSSSVWSIQANAGSSRDEEEDEEGYCCDDDQETVVGDDVLIDDLCEAVGKISVTEFAGKHIRFVYDSDDEEIVSVSCV